MGFVVPFLAALLMGISDTGYNLELFNGIEMAITSP